MGKLVVSTIETQSIKYDSDTTAITINSSGNILQPNLIAFKALGNNPSYVTTSPVPFPTVVYNYGNGYDNSTYTFTAPIGGLYEFIAFFGIYRITANGGSLYGRFVVNGTSLQYAYSSLASSTGYLSATLNETFILSAGDTVKISMTVGNADYYSGPNELHFTGRLIG